MEWLRVEEDPNPYNLPIKDYSGPKQYETMHACNLPNGCLLKVIVELNDYNANTSIANKVHIGKGISVSMTFMPMVNYCCESRNFKSI